MSNNRLASILSSVIPGDSQSAIEAFRKKVLARRLEDEDEGEDAPSITGYAGDEGQQESLESIIADELAYRISNYEAYLDSTVGKKALEAIEFIASERTAIIAVNHYTKDWFETLPASYSMKQEIAAKLIEAIKPYYNYNSPIWHSIASGDPTVLVDITYKFGEV